jgi:Protein of unknown function (DUF3592)
MSILSIIALGCGICLLYIPIRMLYWGIAPLYWKKIEGKLIDIFSEERNNKGITFYIVNVKYEYNISGIKFTGNKLSCNPYMYSSKKAAHALIQKLKTMPHLPIYYNPKMRTHSIILPGINSFPIIIMLLVLILNFIIFYAVFIK